MWVASVDMARPGQPRQRVERTARTSKEADFIRRQLLKQRDEGVSPAKGRISLGAFLTEWLDNKAAEGIRWATERSYRSVTTVHIIPLIGPIPLEQLEAGHIQSMQTRIIKQSGGRTTSANRANRLLRQALKEAVAWGYVSRNVASLVAPPRLGKPRTYALSPEEAARFLEAIKGDPLEALYSVGLAMGLRLGEAFGLRWEDVDFAAGLISVRHNLSRPKGGGWQLAPTKTGQGNRVLDMPQTVVRALKRHAASQEIQRRLQGQRWQDSGFVFTTSLGTPLHEASVWAAYKKVLARAELPNIRMHDLRHSAGSLLLAQGVALEVVSRILGHSDIRVTANIYGHVYDFRMRQAANLMDDVLGDRDRREK
jgi:integrase